MSFWTNTRKHDALEKAESKGEIADSLEVHTNLIKQLHAGEKTLAQVQAELKAIKRNAKRNGLRTRTEVYRQS